MIFDWLIQRKIERSVKRAVDVFVASPKFTAMVDDVIRKSPVVRFVKDMQLEMLRVDPTMDRKLAWDTAIGALRDHLHDEKIQFGDPRYSWGAEAAIGIIHAMEIEHWESVA